MSQEESASESRTAPAFIGPHEERELELMLAGTKPLSMFLQDVEFEFELFPEEDFDRAVAQGKLIKHVTMEMMTDHQGRDIELRRVFYALPGEEWRIKAFLLVEEIYATL